MTRREGEGWREGGGGREVDSGTHGEEREGGGREGGRREGGKVERGTHGEERLVQTCCQKR